MKRFILILLSFIILTSITGCAQKEERFDYPDHFTAQYCYENFSPMSKHYIYSNSYENGLLFSNTKYDGRSRKFRAIPGVDINTFLACETKLGLSGALASYHAVLYKANNYEFDPLNDWKIDNIEICLQKNDVDSSTDKDTIIKYGEYIYYKGISKTSDAMLAKQIVDCINDDTKYINYYDANGWTMLGEHVIFQENESSFYYSIRINFIETDMILWFSSIIRFDGHYYLRYYTDSLYTEYCIPLTEELEAFISSSIDTAN